MIAHLVVPPQKRRKQRQPKMKRVCWRLLTMLFFVSMMAMLQTELPTEHRLNDILFAACEKTATDPPSRSEIIASIVKGAGMAPSPEEVRANTEGTSVAEAIARYRDRAREIMPEAARRDGACRAAYRNIDLKKTKECLHGQDSPDLRYPIDAEAHFNEIRAALAPWAQHYGHMYHSHAGYSGPWIANRFIAHQEQRYEAMISYNQTESASSIDWCLPDLFGPYIPVLVPWTDSWIKSGQKYSTALIDELVGVLRPNVPYLVLVQNAQGWGQGTRYLTKDYLHARNLTVTIMSAGGYGHIPVPLTLGSLKSNRTAIRDRELLTIYTGKTTNAPRNMRQKMHEAMMALDNNSGSIYKHHYGPGWIEAMASAKFNFVPRGYGRTAFHLVEVLQMGLIPIFVYSDIAWLPYGDLLTKGDRPLAYAVRMSEINDLVKDVLPKVSDEDIEEREARILEIFATHFSDEGIMYQIDHFMLQDGQSDLACRALPGSIRDA